MAVMLWRPLETAAVIDLRQVVGSTAAGPTLRLPGAGTPVPVPGEARVTVSTVDVERRAGPQASPRRAGCRPARQGRGLTHFGVGATPLLKRYVYPRSAKQSVSPGSSRGRVVIWRQHRTSRHRVGRVGGVARALDERLVRAVVEGHGSYYSSPGGEGPLRHCSSCQPPSRAGRGRAQSARPPRPGGAISGRMVMLVLRWPTPNIVRPPEPHAAGCSRPAEAGPRP